MRQLNGVYTQRFNRDHGRVGRVFQGRYKAILVERDKRLGSVTPLIPALQRVALPVSFYEI